MLLCTCTCLDGDDDLVAYLVATLFDTWIRQRTAALGPILMRVHKPLQPLEQLYRHPNIETKFVENPPARSQFYTNHRANVSTPRYCQSVTLDRSLFAFVLCFLGQKSS